MTTVTGLVPPLAAFLRPELPPAGLYGLPGEIAMTIRTRKGHQQ
jgi:hypothetical protein